MAKGLKKNVQKNVFLYYYLYICVRLPVKAVKLGNTNYAREVQKDQTQSPTNLRPQFGQRKTGFPASFSIAQRIPSLIVKIANGFLIWQPQ